MTTLIVCATPEEAMFVPANLPLLITGLGKTAAAAHLSRELSRRPEITRVINIGSSGALHDHLTGVHVVGRVINHDISADAIRSLGYEFEDEIALDPTSPIRLATGDVFVTSSTMRSALAQRADLVDMEGFAYAWAARLFDVEAVLVKHVSDNADDSAHDWPTAVKHSALALAGWLHDHV
ncbi:MAG TPA: nucleosidase [Marmoricola sp.]|nr:nucleosidase [Marmoricola sp.]